MLIPKRSAEDEFAHLLSPLTLAVAATQELPQPYVYADHLNHIADRLVVLHQRRGKKRLLITAPPRHGKSELSTHWFPTYALAHDPTTKIIATSYELEQASKFGRAVRRSVLENYQFIGARLIEDSRAAHRWETVHGGGMISAGVRGQITGKGAHIAICDDPIKNAEEANSQTIRDAIWDWWTTTFLSRLEPNQHGDDPIVILILTRWHEDDLAGRVMAQPDFKDVWDHIHLPAIAEADDQLGRAPDEALWPARFDRLFLEGKRAEMGSRAFQALYQGNPQPPGGISINRSWWRYYDAPPKPDEFDQLFLSVDPTFKGNSDSDYVAMGVVGRIGSAFYLMDVTHKQMNGPDTIKAITGPTGYDRRWPNLWCCIEDTASGSMICDILENDRGRIIRGKHKSKQKEVRLSWQVNGAAALIERGAVWLQRDAGWAKKLVDEGAAFPHGKHDDLLDMLVQGLEQVLPRAWAHQRSMAKDASQRPPRDYIDQMSQQLHAAVKKRIAAIAKTRRLEHAGNRQRQFPGF
jgi:predicted phage terminase large subunit-like protein